MSFKVFDKWELSEVKVEDMGLVNKAIREGRRDYSTMSSDSFLAIRNENVYQGHSTHNSSLPKLKPSATIKVQRITLIGPNWNERITIDSKIQIKANGL